MKKKPAPKAAPKAKPATGDISHIVTTKAENGVLNEVHHVPDQRYGYQEPKKHVHATPEAAGNQVSMLMGGKDLMKGQEEPDGDENS
jgi:hypothetical protein